MKFINSLVLILCVFPMSIWSLDYTIIDVTTTTTNEDCISLELTMDFISRGCYGVTGYLDFHDVLDNDLMVEITIGYNVRNYKSFSPTPAHVGPLDFITFMNGFYQKYIMASLEDCSTAPRSTGVWENYDDFSAKWEFEKCVLEIEDFPNTRSGYYNFILSFYKNESDVPFKADLSYIIQIEDSY